MALPMSSSFVHLHVHSEFSILDGACRIPALVDKAARLEMPAVSLTDHGSLAGAIDLYKRPWQGVKPIIGCEVYVADDRQSRLGTAHLTPRRDGRVREPDQALLPAPEATIARGSTGSSCSSTPGLIALSGCLSGVEGDLERRRTRGRPMGGDLRAGNIMAANATIQQPPAPGSRGGVLAATGDVNYLDPPTPTLTSFFLPVG
jgi:hypothetical protein